jgi:hypothetical protein
MDDYFWDDRTYEFEEEDSCFVCPICSVDFALGKVCYFEDEENQAEIEAMTQRTIAKMQLE